MTFERTCTAVVPCTDHSLENVHKECALTICATCRDLMCSRCAMCIMPGAIMADGICRMTTVKDIWLVKEFSYVTNYNKGKCPVSTKKSLYGGQEW